LALACVLASWPILNVDVLRLRSTRGCGLGQNQNLPPEDGRFLNGFFPTKPKTISKDGFWSKIKADVNFKPEEYIEYFEDLIFAPNAEIGPKDFF